MPYFTFTMKTKIALLLILLSLISCGTKKKVSEREKVKTLQIEKKEVDLKTANEISTHIVISEDSRIITIAPADPNKEMTVNGKTFKNAIITSENKKSESQTKIEDKSTTDLKVDESKKEASQSNNRAVDVETESVFKIPKGVYYFSAALIFLFFLIIWYFRRKKRG